MIFLQAAIGAGMLLFMVFIVFIVVGVILFTSIFMKFFREITCNDVSIETKKPYYKDLLPLLISLGISLIISIFLYFLFILFLDFLFPLFGTSN